MKELYCMSFVVMVGGGSWRLFFSGGEGGRRNDKNPSCLRPESWFRVEITLLEYEIMGTFRAVSPHNFDDKSKHSVL